MTQRKYRINHKTASTDQPKKKRSSSRLYTATVEYSMIANLVRMQYETGAGPNFENLLAIPFEDRIPGLIERYGNKTMHHLLVMVVNEFVASLELPAYKRPTETRISVLACEVMLSSYEDLLSLEDIILFLQRAKAGFYGPIKTLVNTAMLFTLLDKYRQERHEAYIKLKNNKEAVLKTIGPVARIAQELTPLNDLFNQAMVIDMTTKMSG